MDAMSKNLSIEEARRLIHKLVNNSDIDTIEKFWLVELNNLHLSISDSNVFIRIDDLRSENSEVSNVLYNNCIKGNIINDLLKKNWRRFFNNNIIEKYNEYIKSKNNGDKVWIMKDININTPL